jgi:hypothetical protein
MRWRRLTEIELLERLARRCCIECGLLPAIDWPYICGVCLMRLAGARAVENIKGSEN